MKCHCSANVPFLNRDLQTSTESFLSEKSDCVKRIAYFGPFRAERD